MKKYKKSVVNIDKNNDKVDIDGKDMEDGKKDIEDFTMDTKFITNLDADIMKLKGADKSARDIISAFSRKLGKKFGNTNKCAKNTTLFFSSRPKKELMMLIKISRILHLLFSGRLEKK